MKPLKSAARRLTRQHFALYRGWLEGAAIEGLHTAYGEPGTDVRVTRRLVTTLRDALAVAARRARDIEAAHLLRLKPGSIPAAELHGRDDTPSLDDYRAQVDPDSVYGEAELLELYRVDFPRKGRPASIGKLPAMRACALARQRRWPAWRRLSPRNRPPVTRWMAGSSQRWPRASVPQGCPLWTICSR